MALPVVDRIGLIPFITGRIIQKGDYEGVMTCEKERLEEIED